MGVTNNVVKNQNTHMHSKHSGNTKNTLNTLERVC